MTPSARWPGVSISTDPAPRAQCFKYPNYFRIVYTAPKDKLEIAYDRIAEFCNKHRTKQA
jgi:hypothetical protein